jgi:mono/diheme cytochrome c family protein
MPFGRTMDNPKITRCALRAVVVLAASLAAASVIGVSAGARAADVERGRLLYETHCIFCHDSRVHKRDSKIATNYDEIRGQVLRRQGNVFLRWSTSDIDAVATYLARSIYTVPCPDC